MLSNSARCRTLLWFTSRGEPSSTIHTQSSSRAQLRRVVKPLLGRFLHSNLPSSSSPPSPLRPTMSHSWSSTDPVTVQVTNNGSQIQLVHHNRTSCFHAPWLWVNDPLSIHASSGQRTRTCTLSAKIQSAELLVLSDDKENGDSASTSNYPRPPIHSFHARGGVYSTHDDHRFLDQHRCVVRIQWQDPTPEQQQQPPMHQTTYFDLDWLLQSRYDNDALEQCETHTSVTKEHALRAGDALTSVSYDDMIAMDLESNTGAVSSSSGPLLKLLHALFETGACRVTHVPPPLEAHDGPLEAVFPVAKVATLLSGNLSHTQLYGPLFHVRSVANANNIAYTSEALSPHQDLSYYQSPPGIQLLHCVQNSDGVVGGASTLVDALAAAHEFRVLAPDLFDVLVHCDATFLKQRHGAEMVYRKPHIQVGSDGSIVSVHWSPPFEGPLFVAEELVTDYYTAYTAFHRMVDNALPQWTAENSDSNHRLLPTLSEDLERSLCEYAHECTWEQKLQKGDVLIFNNQRMLHGRRAFSLLSETNTCERHLIGCYTNIDDTLCRYRLLRRPQTTMTPYIRKAGNGSNGTR